MVRSSEALGFVVIVLLNQNKEPFFDVLGDAGIDAAGATNHSGLALSPFGVMTFHLTGY
jgi:hypothetical protein